MDWQNFFYITASIVLILFGIAVIGAFVVLAMAARLIGRAKKKLDELSDEARFRMRTAARTMGRLNFARFFFKVLRTIL